MELMQVQNNAVREAMEAKRDYEMDEQAKKVEALAQQVRDRATQLIERAKQVEYDALYADERPLYVGPCFFGRDTETLDVLVAQLSEESQLLDNMRKAKAATVELTEKYEAQIDEITANRGEEVPPVGLAAVAGGAYL